NSVATEVRGWSPNLFLFLGDVYEMGTYEEFQNWYDPSWGTMRSVTNPVPGDQEVYYGIQGYEWYWNNELPYYSYDAAGWHFIALTQCAYSSHSFPPDGLCTGSSAEVTWLNDDLAKHPGACTLAYWHEPRFALDGNVPLGSPAEQPLWAPLANNHATAAIAGATVAYNGTGPAGAVSGTTTTDGTGHYSVAGIAVTTYSMMAQASGYQSQPATATVGGGSTTTQNFALTGQATQLSGTVTDASTSKPVAGATVSAGSGSAVTDTTGAYTIAGLAPGTYTATASASGYASQNASVTLTAGNTTTQNFALAPNPGTITGTVTDAGTGAPIAGATVSYSGGSTTTDGSGAYTLANVAEGSYSVTAGATGYTSQSRTVTVGPGGTATQNFALTRPNGAITGTVTSAATGSPISGATVSYSGGSTTTNGSGQYTLSNVATGTYNVTASATGYSSASQSVTVGSGQTAT